MKLYIIVCIVFISATFNSECVKFSSLDVVYKKAVDAYSKERWSECIKQFEGSLHLYKTYKTINVNCRQKCKSESDKTEFTKNFKEFKIYQYFLTSKNCLSQCQKKDFDGVYMYGNVSNAVLSKLQSRMPYAYLHLCYYEMYVLPKAASAAYTYFVANPDDMTMKRNVDYYVQQPEVDVKEVINLEREDYEVLHKSGKEAYYVNNWADTVANMENTLSDYIAWENSCRAECEYQTTQEWSPELTIRIANDIISLLTCRQKCQDKLKPLYDSGVEFIADILHYLQISYYHLNRYHDAAQSVASYLSLYPNDEDMLENKQIYSTLVDEKSFTERSDIVYYLKRDVNEKQLLTIFEKDSNNPISNMV